MEFIAQSSAWSTIPVGEHLLLFSPIIALVCTMLAVVAAPIVVGRGPRTIAGVSAVGVVAAFILAITVARRLPAGAWASSRCPAPRACSSPTTWPSVFRSS